MMLTKNVWPETLVLQQVNRKGEPGGPNPCARESMARTRRFLREKLISDHGHFSSYEGRATWSGERARFEGLFQGCTGLQTAGCWLSRAGFINSRPPPPWTSVFQFSIFCTMCGLRNSELLIKTGWNVICPVCCREHRYSSRSVDGKSDENNSNQQVHTAVQQYIQYRYTILCNHVARNSVLLAESVDTTFFAVHQLRSPR